jgi:hypothetical protein
MIATLLKVLKNCVTGQDNQTEDIIKVCGGFGFFGLIFYMYYIHPTFLEACTGLVTYIAGWAAGIFIKKDTEPKEQVK